MSVYGVLGVLLVIVLVSLVVFTWAACAVAGKCDDDEDEARLRAAAVRQQMRDRALRALGDDDDGRAA